MYNFDSFYCIITVRDYSVTTIANILNQPRPGAPNGSSFAVTSDAKKGHRHIHLSRVSYETLTKEGVMQDTAPGVTDVTIR
jgi:hypothetical protein